MDDDVTEAYDFWGLVWAMITHFFGLSASVRRSAPQREVQSIF
jgi:hypothetical protein